MLRRFQPRRVGCGIAVTGGDLVAVAVRLQPAGVEVLGQIELRDFGERPPDLWGAEYSAFLRGLGLGRVAATFCMPRDKLIFRVLRMPSMRSKDIPKAVALQVADLHPYGEVGVVYASAPLDGGSEGAGGRPVAVAVARADRLRRYTDAFASAGITVDRCTASPGALRAAVRRGPEGAERPFALVLHSDSQLEIYGESSRRPCLSSSLVLEGMTVSMALRLAAEALDAGTGVTASLAMLGEQVLAEPPAGFAPCDADSVLRPVLRAPRGFSFATHILAFGAAVESARPRSGLGLDLLPPAERRSRSAAPSAPRLALGACAVLLGAASLLRPIVQDRRYADRLRKETAVLQDTGEVVASDQAGVADLRRRYDWLLEHQDRTRSDLDLLLELAESLPDSVAIRALEADDSLLVTAGTAENAGAVLRTLSNSPLLDGARFTVSPTVTEDGELFRIEARRR